MILYHIYGKNGSITSYSQTTPWRVSPKSPSRIPTQIDKSKGLNIGGLSGFKCGYNFFQYNQEMLK